MRKAMAILALLAAAPAMAQPIVVADSGDSAWVLGCALLGLLAVLGGLAPFYCRSRGAGTQAVLAASAVATLIFVALGYSLIFAPGSPVLGGASNAMLGGLADVIDGATVSEIVFALFELALALFAVGVVAASSARHARFGWISLFAGLWFLLAYVPVARWIWAGWLGTLGALDYAGGIAVQISAGVAALITAILLRGSAPDDGDDGARHSATGAGLVAIGWLGLIGGSALGAGADAASAILNAILAASAAVMTGLIITVSRRRDYSADPASAHALAGLAAISAGAAFVGPAGAMILGVVAAIAAIGAAAFATSIKLGDGGRAFAIHGAPAIFGALLFPVVMIPALGGADFAIGSNMASLLAAQGVAVFAVMLWSALATLVAALIVSLVVPMKLAKAL